MTEDFAIIIRDNTEILKTYKGNEKDVIIHSGLKENDKVLYVPPDNFETKLSVYRIRINGI